MKRNNNKNEKENKMTKFRDYAAKVASQMKKGLTNENSQICEIGRVLRDSGLSHVEVNYHMNVDEDFIPDVLQSYNPPKKRVNSIQLINNLNPWIRHPKKT